MNFGPKEDYMLFFALFSLTLSLLLALGTNQVTTPSLTLATPHLTLFFQYLIQLIELYCSLHLIHHYVQCLLPLCRNYGVELQLLMKF